MFLFLLVLGSLGLNACSGTGTGNMGEGILGEVDQNSHFSNPDSGGNSIAPTIAEPGEADVEGPVQTPPAPGGKWGSLDEIASPPVHNDSDSVLPGSKFSVSDSFAAAGRSDQDESNSGESELDEAEDEATGNVDEDWDQDDPNDQDEPW